MFLTTPSMTWPSSRFCTSSWRCSARVSSSTVRRDTTMLPRRRSIFRIWNGCGWFISGDTSRIGRMSTWLRGRNATAPSRSTVKPPLTWLKMTPWTFSLLLKAFSSLPQLSSRPALAREDGFPERILHPLQVDLDGVADLDLRLTARPGEFAQRHAPFGLGPDVDDSEVLLDADDLAFYDGALLGAALGKGLFEHLRKI